MPWSTRSPPGLSASGAISTRTWVGPSSRPWPWIQVTLFLSIEALEAGPQPLHDLVAPLGHARVVERPGRRPRCRTPSRAGSARRTRPTRAAPSSGCSRCGGTCRRSCAWSTRATFRPELGRAECRGVAAGAGAEDDEIEVVGGADGHRADGTARGLDRAHRRAGRCILARGASRRSSRADGRLDARGAAPPGHPGRRRLPRRLDPRRRARRAGERRPRSADDRLRSNGRHERAAGARPEVGRGRRRRRPRQGRASRCSSPAS